MMPRNSFFDAALAEVPRLLGQIDRMPMSRTYGSCDRAFWHYRTNDISSERYQEAALTLALLYVTPIERSPYYGDPDILAWANAAIRFACKTQHKDGSFDEWYVHEGSFVCTAFVSAALSEAALVLGDGLEERNELLHALRRSAEWLMRRSETLVVNQLSGAVVALYNIFLLTDDETYKRAAEEKLDTLLSLQTSEGWWSEYGGPDIGYLSLTVDYLARYMARTGDTRAAEAVARAVAFLDHFIEPDGTAGGEYMARNTEYLIPSGFLRTDSVRARSVACRIAGFLAEGKGVTPRSLDDRYTCYILYNWLEAGRLWAAAQSLVAEPSSTLWKQDYEAFFPEAGIHVVRGARMRFVVNLKKGGSFRLYTREGMLADSGPMLRRGGDAYAANIVRPDAEIFRSPDSLRTSGELVRIKAPLLTTLPSVVLKAFQLSVGRLPTTRQLLKRILRIVSVLKPGRASGVRFKRSITVAAQAVTVTDEVSVPVDRRDLLVGIPIVYALVPSSRYAPGGSPHAPLTPDRETFEAEGRETRLTRVFNVQ